jgi:hypothetical protein
MQTQRLQITRFLSLIVFVVSVGLTECARCLAQENPGLRWWWECWRWTSDRPRWRC